MRYGKCAALQPELSKDSSGIPAFTSGTKRPAKQKQRDVVLEKAALARHKLAEALPTGTANLSPRARLSDGHNASCCARTLKQIELQGVHHRESQLT